MTVKNIPASVHRRLLNVSREKNRPFQELLQYYAMERFLYRLSQTKHRDRFLLKGALLLQVWSPDLARATKDIDLLGKGENSPENLELVVKEGCIVEFPEDGMSFHSKTVEAVKIKEGAEYEGVRVSFQGSLGEARVSMQIDVGFGDSVVPEPKIEEYPSLLNFPKPKLRCYPKESVVAEKFQAMTQLGLFNSRMKDFYDLWYLSQQFEFNGETLSKAIRETFSRRGTAIDLKPTALSGAFSGDKSKQAQWSGFVRKTRIAIPSPDLPTVLSLLSDFLLPVAEAAKDNLSFKKTWKAPGPWS